MWARALINIFTFRSQSASCCVSLPGSLPKSPNVNNNCNNVQEYLLVEIFFFPPFSKRRMIGTKRGVMIWNTHWENNNRTKQNKKCSDKRQIKASLLLLGIMEFFSFQVWLLSFHKQLLLLTCKTFSIHLCFFTNFLSSFFSSFCSFCAGESADSGLRDWKTDKAAEESRRRSQEEVKINYLSNFYFYSRRMKERRKCQWDVGPLEPFLSIWRKCLSLLEPLLLHPHCATSIYRPWHENFSSGPHFPPQSFAKRTLRALRIWTSSSCFCECLAKPQWKLIASQTIQGSYLFWKESVKSGFSIFPGVD